jgi:ABC-type sulfate/molybdate transport systems ATPase subunit
MLELSIARAIGTLDLSVDLSVGTETILVAGPNGAGKSTLLKLLLGILRPDSGRIFLDGSALFDRRREIAVEERRLGYVPQDSALFPHLDVLGNVAFGLAGLPRSERRARAIAWLAQLGVSHLARRRVTALSGGERQRVALARALAPGPRALLLDEPFASLDPGSRRELRDALRHWLADWRLPALIVSHDPADAVVASRIAVLEAGRIVQQGTPEELRQAPSSQFVAGFAAAPVP